MTDSNLRDQVRQFICKNFYVENTAALLDDSSLLERGIVDSTGVLELIEFVETTFGIKVEDEEMIPENLDTIDRIVAFLKQKKGQV